MDKTKAPKKAGQDHKRKLVLDDLFETALKAVKKKHPNLILDPKGIKNGL